VVQNKRSKHGWYIVKNRSSTEAQDNVSLEVVRELETALFTSPGWANVPDLQKEWLGISALRTALSNVCCAYIRTEFARFSEQTRSLLKEKQVELNRLGPSRDTEKEQRQHLKALVAAYQVPKKRCLFEDFRDDLPNGSEPKHLHRRLAIEKKVNLRDRLQNQGVLWEFQHATSEADEMSDKAASASFDPNTCNNIYTWINHRYQKTKSCSLPGLVPFKLVEILFKEQTQPWKPIIEEFVQGVQRVLREAIEYCLMIACNNKRVLESTKECLMKRLEAKMQTLLEFCSELIQSEQDGLQVIACEAQFVSSLREARTLRIISALARLENEQLADKGALLDPDVATGVIGLETSSGTSTPSRGGLGQPSLFGHAKSSEAATSPKPPVISSFYRPQNINVDAPKSASSHLTTSHASHRPVSTFAKDNKDRLGKLLTDDRQVVYEIHDILKADYSFSVQHFTDTVCKVGVKQSFIEDTMNLFSDQFVDSLSDAEVASISAERIPDRKARRTLTRHIERLEAVILDSEAILREPIITVDGKTRE
jgi:hypothetical protein